MGRKKKLEFSKIIFLCTAILFTLVVVGSFVLMWRTSNTDALSYLIPSTAAMVTGNIALYTWKARIENIIKLSKKHGLSIKEIKSLTNDTEETYEDNQTNYGDDM